MALIEEAVNQQVVGMGLFIMAAVMVGAGIANGPDRDDDDGPS